MREYPSTLQHALLGNDEDISLVKIIQAQNLVSHVNTKLLRSNLFAHYIDSSPLLIYDFVAVTHDASNVRDLAMRSCNLVHISGRLDILGETNVLVHRQKSNVGNLRATLVLNTEH
jgi:hypothetical protein